MKKLLGTWKLWFSCVVLGLIGTVYFLTFAGDLCARPHRLARIPDVKFRCGVCHVSQAGGGARNTFGNDYAILGIRAGDKYTDELGAKDSDGDGYSNNDEFAAGTHPGDPDSKPAK
jgi:hypothetical protein